MASRARIRRKFQVTIPQEVRDAYPLKEGQYVSMEATPKGIVITLVREVDPAQAWFWSPQWSAMEREADEDFLSGRVTRSGSADEAVAALRKKPPCRGRR